MFDEIRTERLTLRGARPDDVDALFDRRSEPDVARYQGWSLPLPRERAQEAIDGSCALDGPTDGQWWMATVCRTADDEILGDYAVKLTNEGRFAEIGVTFAGAFWGHGYALEAGTALVRTLFESYGVRRVSAKTHPDNVASARLQEALGMELEGRTRTTFWLEDEQTDDLLWGMTDESWRQWIDRPRTPPDTVSLVEVTPDNHRAVARLHTHHTQREFVAPVADSYGDALFPEVVDGAPVVPWMRAVDADGELVAFVMLTSVTAHHPRPVLWRLLVDRLHQRRGLGTRILDLVSEQARTWGADRLDVSWGEGRGSPRPFYERYGFETTGRVVDGETEATLTLHP